MKEYLKSKFTETIIDILPKVLSAAIFLILTTLLGANYDTGEIFMVSLLFCIWVDIRNEIKEVE